MRSSSLIACALLMSIAGATNDCSLSLKNHILTCENVEWHSPSPTTTTTTDQDDDDGGGGGGVEVTTTTSTERVHFIEQHLSNETVVLVLKSAGALTLRPEMHAGGAFGALHSYQIVGARGRLRIAAASFAGAPALEYVKICDNHAYARVVKDTFVGLARLKTLNLNNNSIHDVAAGAFNGLRTLETLELTHNDFATVRAGVFGALAHLRSLFLYHNNIEVLEAGCLDGLQRLAVLDLTYNRIQRIAAEMLNAGAPNVQQLYLSYNQIDRIDGALQLDKLEFLYVQNNKLRSVDGETFAKLPALLDVDLSRNRIAEMSTRAFYECAKLTNVNYKENTLKQRVEFEFADNSTRPLITA